MMFGVISLSDFPEKYETEQSSSNSAQSFTLKNNLVEVHSKVL